MVMLAQLIKHRLLDITKSLFALARKVFADGTTQALFDHMVRIDKGHAQPPRKLAPDGGFACTGQANKDDAQRRLAHKAQNPCSRTR